MTAGLLVVVFGVSAAFVPRFLDAAYLFDRSSLYMEAGLMALGMTFVIVGGHIDLSCASMLALVGTVIATLHVKLGWPLLPLVFLAPLLGAALGGINGIVVARLGLPSLVVTLATMALYRGLAQVLLGDHSLNLPSWFTGIERVTIAGTMVLFLGMAAALGWVLHQTVFGTWLFATGTNAEAAQYSGVPVGRVTISVFVISGVLSAMAAIIMISRLGVARYDHALGLELDVITAVVLGGASIFGGRGTVAGTVLALFLIAVLQTGMGVANVKAEYQATASGALLILAVLMSNFSAKLRTWTQMR
jgi:rhamnose transport system permease protein